ncbi:MAG: DUF3786 domain-containing protein [Thermodesulfobacteriota bacterium]
MSRFNTVMDVFKLLDKSNCRACNEKTCLAFAAAVFQGRRPLSDCPRLSPEVLREYGGPVEKKPTISDGMEEFVAHLKKEVAAIDLAEAAARTGGVFSGGRLTLKVMGKDFHIYPDGRMASDIHVNPWLAIPLLTYVLKSAGLPPVGRWMPFRELKNGAERNGLFVQRTELPLKKVADTYTNLFEDMVHLFNGKRVESFYESDISIVLYPLPLVPIMICYWKPDEGLESSLNIFFDKSVEQNLGVEALYGLIAGIVQMFEKISLRHGVQGA